MKKFTKIEDIVNNSTDNVEVVIGLKGTNTVMFIDKKLKPIAEKIFTSISKEFDTYLTKGGETVPLFVVKPEDFVKIIKVFEKQKETIQ